MARTEARIKCAIWKERDWRSLSHTAQWLYELLLTQSDLSMCGIVSYNPDRWAKMAKGLTSAKVTAALSELAKSDYVVVDRETGEVWVRTFAKHDGVLNVPGTRVAMMKDFDGILSEQIAGLFLDGLGDGFVEQTIERFPKWFADPKNVIPEGFADASAERSAERSRERAPTDSDRRLPTDDRRPLASAEIAERSAGPPARRDELFEAVAEVCGIDWQTDLTTAARGPLNKAVAGLRSVGAEPQQVRQRAVNWPYENATLTPTALEKHWPQLAHPPSRGRSENQGAIARVFDRLETP